MRHVIKNSIWQGQTEKEISSINSRCDIVVQYTHIYLNTRFICFDLEENDYYQTTKLYDHTKSILFHNFAYC